MNVAVHQNGFACLLPCNVVSIASTIGFTCREFETSNVLLDKIVQGKKAFQNLQYVEHSMYQYIYVLA